MAQIRHRLQTKRACIAASPCVYWRATHGRAPLGSTFSELYGPRSRLPQSQKLRGQLGPALD
jgi:hypothetical protein